MDPIIRGVLEQSLDSQLTEESLQINFNLYKSFKDENLIDSIESAMISQIYTKLVLFYFMMEKGNEISVKDDMELVQMFFSRSQIIKTRIREVCNL